MKLDVLPDRPIVVPCTSCAFRAECGGLDEQQSLWGCFTACSTDCVDRGCDWTCPGRPSDFIERMRDVGGFSTEGVTLKPLNAAELPTYVPLIHHGYGRGGDEDLALEAGVVAISIKDVFKLRKDGTLDVVADDAQGLRRRFGLRDDGKVLLVCVSNDRPLERYWARRRLDSLPARLATLGLVGVTLPNYSFFEDAPRTHTLWNRRRMLCAGEELSAQGLCVVPHLNALTSEDWRFWKDFLRARPDVSVVAKEFQTGLRDKDKGSNAIVALRRLQEDVGRPLRLIAVGATRYLKSIKDVFASVTLVDSSPFVRAMNRRARVAGASTPQWRKVSVPPGPELLDLLNGNIRAHAAYIARSLGA